MKFTRLILGLLFGFIPAIYPIAPGRASLAKVTSDCIASKTVLEAVQNGQLDKIKRVISPKDINCPNQNGITPLMFATYYGHTPIVQFLLSRKASIDFASYANHDFNFGKLLSNRNNKTTALMLAAFAGKFEIVLTLLKAAAKDKELKELLKYVNAQDSDGQTALIYVILADKNWPNAPLSENRKKIISLLLEFGADASLADNNGLDARYYYSHVAGLVAGFGDRFEKDADLAEQDELLLRMKSLI
jgi:uncharacterized protein